VKLSIVIPVYNEMATLDEILRRVRAARIPLKKEIVLVDDCSTDGSREKLEAIGDHGFDATRSPEPASAELTDAPEAAALSGVSDGADVAPAGDHAQAGSGEGESIEWRVHFHPVNRGKGAAIRTGIQACTGDYVLIQDADLEYDPNDYPRLLAPLLDGRADVVYGSRFIGGQSHRVLYFWHSVANRALTLLSNMFTNLNLTDMEVCYKVFRRPIIQGVELEEDRFGFEPEVTAKLARERCRIYEVGVSYSGRTYAEGKKISYRDGLRAVWCVIKYNLLLRHRGRTCLNERERA